MVRRCWAPGCKNRTNDKKSKPRRSFFRFPSAADDVILQQWIGALGLPADFKPMPNTRICSDHFTEDCYFQDKPLNHKWLKPDAVPLPNPTKCDASEQVRQKSTRRRNRKKKWQENKSLTSVQDQEPQSDKCDKTASNKSNGCKKKVCNDGVHWPSKLMSLEHVTQLCKELTDLQQEIVLNVLSGSSGSDINNYTDTFKEFACTLYCHSPLAYRYLCGVLHLPQPSIVQMWYNTWLPKDMENDDVMADEEHCNGRDNDDDEYDSDETVLNGSRSKWLAD